MSQPLVSVLIPVYNVENYLPVCLDSVLAQTLTEMEIICVNDGSTDKSLEILREYQKKDARIQVIDKENGGLPSARNAALDRAAGQYVGFIDSDDYIEAEMFQKLYETAESSGSEIVICGAEVFPEEPHAENWLYEALSPSYHYYEKFEPELLFGKKGTTPFLWRVFVKRELIEREHLRLDETIHLGEDKAFQAKLYPKAKGITVIPDKLYHYCWHRSGSMMADLLYVSSKKAIAHIHLTAHIAELMQEETEETRLSFLKWSIPFLYADYIYLPLEEKIAYAETLLYAWIRCGYYSCCKKIEGWIREQFSYITKMQKEQAEEVKVSLILPVDGRAEHMAECLDGIGRQRLKEMEIILVNCGASNQVYSVLHKKLFSDKRIRLYNMPPKAYAKVLQIGERLAVGEYLLFADCNGWYASERIIEQWYQYSRKKKADLCASASLWQESRLIFAEQKKEVTDYLVSETEYYHADFRNVMYRKEFLAEKEILFRECAAFTGELFLLECLMAAEKKEYYPAYNYIQCRRTEKMDVSEEKGKKLLQGMYEVMQKTIETENPYAHAKILDMLCSNYLKNVLLSCMHVRTGESEEQLEILLKLYGLYRLVNLGLLKKGGYRTNKIFYTNILYEVLKERQKELADLSLEVLRR